MYSKLPQSTLDEEEFGGLWELAKEGPLHSSLDVLAFEEDKIVVARQSLSEDHTFLKV